MAQLPGLRVSLTLDSAQFVDAAKRVQRDVEGMATGFRTATSALKGLAAGLGASLSVGAFIQFTRGAIAKAHRFPDFGTVKQLIHDQRERAATA